MKYRITPIERERVMREDDFIVSKTDLKGRITYCNQIFIEFSGYTERELIGSPHNIVRHPDMPRGLFRLLWQTLRSERECFAYIKNMAKDGGYYWVFATVTPSFDGEGKVIGYYSVRRAPKREAIEVMEDIYRQMLRAENEARTADQPDASLALLNKILNGRGTTYADFIVSI